MNFDDSDYIGYYDNNKLNGNGIQILLMGILLSETSTKVGVPRAISSKFLRPMARVMKTVSLESGNTIMIRIVYCDANIPGIGTMARLRRKAIEFLLLKILERKNTINWFE